MIQRFRKKPVVVEAFQFTAEMRKGPLLFGLTWSGSSMADLVVYCETLEGRMKVSDGDWIIRGVKGEFYPSKPDIFEATYQAADQEDVALTKAKLWLHRVDISPHIHPAMAGLLERYLAASVEECQAWNQSVELDRKGRTG